MAMSAEEQLAALKEAIRDQYREMAPHTRAPVPYGGCDALQMLCDRVGDNELKAQLAAIQRELGPRL